MKIGNNACRIDGDFSRVRESELAAKKIAFYFAEA